MTQPTDIFAQLAQVLANRHPEQGGDPETSYAARLFHQGPNAFLKKIGEEATEVVCAAKDNDKQQLIAEMADLWFHCLVVLSYYHVQPKEVLDELSRRQGLSGLDEKAARKQGSS
ncbi:MAG TPA: phosphoribosyl-ATP diphosphatase [Paenalcaligenes sp.]|nr:phosphoribosyl-ATP diphosphatase [Paenalcaligenes sp.]